MRLVHAREFVITEPEGDINVNETRDALLLAAQAAERAGEADMLFDCRRVTSDMSLGEITSLVHMMLTHRALFGRKVAILAPLGQKLETMKFMEDFAVNRGLEVGAFGDYEQALEWLMPSTRIAHAAE